MSYICKGFYFDTSSATSSAYYEHNHYTTISSQFLFYPYCCKQSALQLCMHVCPLKHMCLIISDAYICTIISASVLAASAILTPAYDISKSFVNPEVQVVP